MSFYGNIREDMTKAQFQFDRIYSNRFAMDSAIGNTSDLQNVTDGVFVGRFVLVDYNLDPEQGNASSELGYVGEKISGNYFTLKKLSDDTYYYEDELDKKLPEDGFQLVTAIETSNKVSYIVYYQYSKKNSPHKQEAAAETYTDENNEEVTRYKALFTQYKFVKFQGAKELETDVSTEEAVIRAANAEIDTEYYGGDYDATVWQKIVNSNKEEYLLVARLNSKMPTLTGWAIGPAEKPQVKMSSLTNYFLKIPDPWKVKGIVNINENDPVVNETTRLTSAQVDDLGNDSVEIRQIRDPNLSERYQNTRGGYRSDADQPNDVLEFAFSLPGFKKVLNNFWDLIYGGNGDDTTRKTNLNFYGKTVHISGTNEAGNYTTKDVDLMTEADWATVKKQFDPTTVGGLINLIQLYLGKGAIPVGASAQNWNAIEGEAQKQDQLRVWYNNNYIIPETAIPSSDGVDKADFFGLKYVQKISNFKRINTEGSGFTIDSTGTISKVPENVSVFKKTGENVYERTTVAEGNKDNENLYYLDGYSYELRDILAGDSILEILAELYKKFNFGDPQSRDPETIMGLFNELKDKVNNLSEQLRNDIVWDVSNPDDATIMKQVFGSDAVDERWKADYPYYTLDDVIRSLGNTYQTEAKSHLIRTVENENNEMSARLVFAQRATEEEKKDLTESQGIVYDGSVYKTSAIRFLDNDVEYGKTKVTKDILNTVTTGDYYIIDENNQFKKIDVFSFNVEDDPSSSDDSIVIVTQSDKEDENDLNYDYYYLTANEDLYVGNAANNPGNGISIGSGGLTVLGSGEGPSLYEKYVINNGESAIYPNSEELVLLSDNEIRLYANLNDYKAEWDEYGKVSNANYIALLDSMREYGNIYYKLDDARTQLAEWRKDVGNFNSAMQKYILYLGYRKTRESYESHWNTVTGSVEGEARINNSFDLVQNKNGENYTVWNPSDERIQDEKVPNSVYLERIETTEEVNNSIYYYYKYDNNNKKYQIQALNSFSSSEPQEEIYGKLYFSNLYKLPVNPGFSYVKFRNGQLVNLKPGIHFDANETRPDILGYLKSIYSEDENLYFTKISNKSEIPSGDFLIFTKNVETNTFIPQSGTFSDSIINQGLISSGPEYLRGFLIYQGEYLWPQNMENSNYYVLNKEISLQKEIDSNKNIKEYNSSEDIAFGYSKTDRKFLIKASTVLGATVSQSPIFPAIDKASVSFRRNAYIGRVNSSDSTFFLICSEADFAKCSEIREIKWTLVTPNIEDYRVLTLSKNGLKFSSLQIGENNILTEDSSGSLVLNDNRVIYDNSRVTWGLENPDDNNGRIGDLYIQLRE